jgi:hypothetical protein
VESYRLEVKHSAAKDIAELPKAECQHFPRDRRLDEIRDDREGGQPQGSLSLILANIWRLTHP